jgi:electron transfer flavoprotein alpha/beta subunit
VKTAAELGLAGQVGAAAAKMSIEKVYVPLKGEGAEMIEGSAADVAQVLVGKIRELGLL